MVLGGLGFLYFPYGIVAIILAVIAKKKEESLADVALKVTIFEAIFLMIIGAIVGAILLS